MPSFSRPRAMARRQIKKKGAQASHLCGINHCMLRESEAETEACGCWISSVVFAGGIWRKTVPPSSTCAEIRMDAWSRTVARPLRQQLPAHPSLLCRVQRDARLTRGILRPPRGRVFVQGTSESYEHSTHVGGGALSSAPLHAGSSPPSRAPRAHEWLDSGDWPRPSRQAERRRSEQTYLNSGARPPSRQPSLLEGGSSISLSLPSLLCRVHVMSVNAARVAGTCARLGRHTGTLYLTCSLVACVARGPSTLREGAPFVGIIMHRNTLITPSLFPFNHPHHLFKRQFLSQRSWL